MASKQDSDELFELTGNSPSSWLHQARSLKTAAQLPLDELARIKASDLSPADRSEALMSHIQSYMLLTSFSFENLIKGILTSRKPNMVDGKSLSTALWDNKNGHKVVDIIPADIILSDQERDLFIRLQAFAIWAGRYPIPMNSHDYHSAQSLLKYETTDPLIAEELFFRLVKYVIY
ncbi:hypothetical protein [Spirosoma endophyticum]|uniref:Uncharacterized protein n=1 Tax=Spirosoma endophyticum TaxID=662367 RepID=A0A1I2H7J2_9BACT|nr:hypothetical protein [Spirosoma endophyticum]SFF24611.1 hypothetical protein SAMN05216167_1385 [Spirosoma endophyticum]